MRFSGEVGKNRILSFLLAASMLFSMLPTTAFAIREDGSMPARSFSGGTGAVSVVAEADEGVFPAGTTMSVAPAGAEEAISAARELYGENEEVIDAVAVDITFRDAEGNELQPAKADGIHVKLTLKGEVQGDSFELIHLDDDGNATEVANAKVEADFAAFDASEFSIYAIVGTGAVVRRTYVFYVNGEEYYRQIVKNGDVLVEPDLPASGSPDLYFIGWYDDSGRELPFVLGSMTVSDIISLSDETVEINARFTNELSISFFNADGTEIIYTLVGENGMEMRLADANIIVPAGRELTGWVDMDTDDEYAPDDTITLSGRNVRLKALAISYFKALFDVGDEGSFVAPDYVKEGEALSEPEAPTRPGYTFAGWFKDEELLEGYDFSEPVTEDITLYAAWESETVSYQVFIWGEILDDDGHQINGDERYSIITSFAGEALAGSEVFWSDLREEFEENVARETFDLRYYTEAEASAEASRQRRRLRDFERLLRSARIHADFHR